MTTIWLLLEIFAILVVKSVYVRFRNPLSSIPPVHWSVKWVGYYNLFIKYAHCIRHIYYDAHLNVDGNGFRPVVRTGPNEISIMTSEGVKTVFGGDFERTTWYSAFWNYGKPNMFSFASSRAHIKRKRILASAYSKTAVSQYRTQNIIKNCTEKLTHFIDQQMSRSRSSFGKTGPIVVRNAFRALQADIFIAFTFSEVDGTGFLDNLKTGSNSLEDMDMDMLDLCHEEKRDAFFFWESEEPFKRIGRFVKPNALAIHMEACRWLSNVISRYETKMQLSKEIESQKEHSTRFESGTYRKLLLWRNPDTSKPLDWNERASEIMDHMVAGQDAVPAVLEFIVRKLSADSKIQAQVGAELLNSTARVTSNRTYAMIDELPYLNAVVMESLRLVDTISSYITRVVPEEGCTISGHYIPAGTTVSAQPYLMNRHPSIFQNPEMFDPSRWLLPSESYRALARNLWTYSSGPRACLGRELSLATIKTLIFEIYTKYKTSLLNEDRTEKRPWEGANRMAEVQFELISTHEHSEFTKQENF